MANPFKLAILFGDAPDRPTEQICPGWEVAEIPMGLLVKPFDSNALWAKARAQIQAYKLPPIKIASHFLHDFGLVATGPDVDFDQLTFSAQRGLARLAELGVEIAGVYGLFFPVPEGFSRTKATDQAVRYFNMVADHAQRHNMLIAIEPMAGPVSLFPRYLDGLALAREINRPQIRVMADLNYFIKLNQPLEDIAKVPEYCIHAHIAGEKGQPGIGDRVAIHKRFFQVLKDIGYTRAVSAACPWVSSTPGPMNFAQETARTLKYLQDLRAKVYGL